MARKRAAPPPYPAQPTPTDDDHVVADVEPFTPFGAVNEADVAAAGTLFDEELTPPVADLPTTGQAVEDLLAANELYKQQAAEAIEREHKANSEAERLCGEVSELRADLDMVRASLEAASMSDADRVRLLEEGHAEKIRGLEESRAQAFNDAHEAALRISDLEGRLLTSEMDRTELSTDLERMKGVIASIAKKKIFALNLRKSEAQTKPVRIHVLAENLVEAVQRAIKAQVLTSAEEVTGSSILVETVYF